MNMVLTLMFGMTLLWSVASVAHPQTERYIPIGQSPGTADLVRGTISSQDGNQLTIDGMSVVLEEHTPVWFDRTLFGRSGLVGHRADCRAGRFVEVRYHTMDGEHVARWVKIRGQ